jgi:hypothetical protein
MDSMEIYETFCRSKFEANEIDHREIKANLNELDKKLDDISKSMVRVEDHIFNGLSSKIDFLHKDLEDRRKAWRGTIIGVAVTAAIGVIAASTRWIFHLLGH